MSTENKPKRPQHPLFDCDNVEAVMGFVDGLFLALMSLIEMRNYAAGLELLEWYEKHFHLDNSDDPLAPRLNAQIAEMREEFLRSLEGEMSDALRGRVSKTRGEA